ncbi:hypothetical protein [Mycolicibacterium houstonense]|uniref:hypothetical protein n=1 Tax=Mycolicibacterium houstonense TaxID=146021 RepID=UPI001357A5D5|nr:hypothetical protein [Mycolicibacterium houstonense]
MAAIQALRPEGSSTSTKPTPAAAAMRDTSSRSSGSPITASTVPVGVVDVSVVAMCPPSGQPRGRRHHQFADCG